MIVMSSSLFMAHVTRRTDPCRFCFFFSRHKACVETDCYGFSHDYFNVLHYYMLFTAVNCHTTFCWSCMFRCKFSP